MAAIKIDFLLFSAVRLAQAAQHGSVDSICSDLQESKISVGAAGGTLGEF